MSYASNCLRALSWATRIRPPILLNIQPSVTPEALSQALKNPTVSGVALRTESYIAARAARANVPKALTILKRAGVGRRPGKGDEMPRSSRKQRPA